MIEAAHNNIIIASVKQEGVGPSQSHTANNDAVRMYAATAVFYKDWLGNPNFDSPMKLGRILSIGSTITNYKVNDVVFYNECKFSLVLKYPQSEQLECYIITEDNIIGILDKSYKIKVK